LGYAASPTEIALAAVSLKEKKRTPSLVVGEPLLKGEFDVSGSGNDEPVRVVMINHLEKGLSNHCMILKSGADNV